MMFKKIIFAILYSILFCCCEKNLNTIGTELTVTTSATGIQIINNTTMSINYIVVEINTAARIEWAVTCDHTNLNPGDSRDITYSKILGYSAGCKLIVYWWYCIQNSKPGPVNNITVTAY